MNGVINGKNYNASALFKDAKGCLTIRYNDFSIHFGHARNRMKETFDKSYIADADQTSSTSVSALFFQSTLPPVFRQ